MKVVTNLAVLAAALALSSPVFAQAASRNVVVSANLTSVCRFVTGADLAITVDYTAFQSADATKTGTAGIECTRSTTAPTLSFDSTSGVVAGLAFTVAQSYAETAAGADPSGTSPLGTPRTGDVTVTATIAGGQAGSGASGTTAAAAKVLTVAF